MTGIKTQEEKLKEHLKHISIALTAYWYRYRLAANQSSIYVYAEP